MRFADGEIERVRAGSDLVAISSETVQPKRVGRRWMASCPFHDDRSPSLSINGEDGLWMCFGCQEGGDTIDWVQRIHGLDFVDAVHWLARRAGVSVATIGDAEAGSKRSTLLDLVTAAASWYHTQLLSPAGAPARQYLAERGVTGELIERFELGWAPAGWDELATGLGADHVLLTAAGLGRTNRADRFQDFFRSRVMFPISDAGGTVVGFGGRLLPGADGPKYLNSPGGSLYDKSQVLYGLHHAKSHAVRNDQVVISEGYLDVLGCVAAGIEAAVASCGTALTESHVTTLGRFTKRMVLAFDADQGGQRAAARMHQWEADHQLDLCVASFAQGDDPGSLGFENPAALVAAIDDAVPFLQFRLDQVLADVGDTIESRARCAHRACEVIADHPNPMVRDDYLAQIAQRLGLNLDTLRTTAADVSPTIRTGPGPQTSESPAARLLHGLPPVELEALQAAIEEHPERPSWLIAHLFTHQGARGAVEALHGSAEMTQALDQADAAARAVLVAAAVAPDLPGTAEEIGARLVGARAETAIKEISGAAKIDIDLMAQLQRHLQDLRSPTTQEAAVSSLIALLAPG